MSDAFTFVAQAAAAGNLKFEVSFKKRTGSTTDPSDQRDSWGCRFLSPTTGRVLGEWNNFEVREEMFETAARALALTAATQLGTWDKQIQAKQDADAKKALEEKAEAAKVETESRKAEIEAAVATAQDELIDHDPVDANGEDEVVGVTRDMTASERQMAEDAEDAE